MIYGVVVWASFAVYAKRLHDLGQSGWLMLIGVIPLVGWALLIWLGFFPGNDGENRYGAEPS